MDKHDHSSEGRLTRAITGVLLALLTVAALASLLGLFLGIALLRMGRTGTVVDAPRPATVASASPAHQSPDTGADAVHPSGPPNPGQPSPLRMTAARRDSPRSPEAAPVAPAPPRAAQASASLLRVDDDSAGRWAGRFGNRGYRLAMPGEPTSLPGGVSMSLNGAQLYIWSAVTTDRRSLSVPSDPPRLSAGQWFAWENFSLDLDLRARGEAIQVALYLLDWDSDTRAQRLEVSDAESGAVLLTRADEHFRNGRYVILRISGHVQLRFTKTAGANCTLSGVFFEDAPADAH